MLIQPYVLNEHKNYVAKFNKQDNKLSSIKLIEEHLNRHYKYFKVLYPKYSFVIDDQPGLAYMNHSQMIFHFNPAEIYDHFNNQINYYISYRFNYRSFWEHITESLIYHEAGHIYVTLEAEKVEMIWTNNKRSIPYNFFHMMINIVDDTVLQNISSNLYYFTKYSMSYLAIFGQGTNALHNYLNSDTNTYHNILYYLIIYAYKDFVPRTSYDLYYMNHINLPQKIEFFTDNDLLWFDKIRLILDNQKRTDEVYKFAETIYKRLLNTDFQDDTKQKQSSESSDTKLSQEQSSNLNGTSNGEIEKAISEAVQKIAADNNHNEINLSKSSKKELGSRPMEHSEPTKHNLKSNFEKEFIDSFKKLIIEDESGDYYNLKRGNLDLDRVFKEEFSNKIFKQSYEEINKPEIFLNFVLDCSGSMSTWFDRNKEETLYDLSVSIALALQSGLINNFPNTKFINYTFSEKAIYIGDNFNKQFDYEQMAQLFYGGNDHGGTDPEAVLQIVSDNLPVIDYKNKLTIIITDGEFDESNQIKEYIKNIESESLTVIVNITDYKFKVFKNSIILNHNKNTIKSLPDQLIEIIRNNIIMK
jgi:hypothetical protein